MSSAFSSAGPMPNGSSHPGRLRASATTPASASIAPGEPTPTPFRSPVFAPASSAASRTVSTMWATTSGGPPLIGVA